MLGLLEIFYAPGTVFGRVRDRGTWLAPFVGVMLLALLTSTVVINLVGMETIVRKRIESDPKTVERLGPEGVEKQIQMANSPVVKAISYSAPPLAAAVVILAMAGILMGALSLSGSTVRYPQMLGTVAYSSFPFTFLAFLMITLILNLTANRADIDLQNAIALNVGAFLDKLTTSKFLYSLATSLDLLSLGQILLLSYGLSKVARLAMGRCLGLVLVLWAVWIVAKAGVSSLF